MQRYSLMETDLEERRRSGGAAESSDFCGKEDKSAGSDDLTFASVSTISHIPVAARVLYIRSL